MGLQAVSLSHEDYTLFSGISTAISRSSGLQFRQSARAYRFATEILVFFRHQFRTCRSEHRHHSAISLCALPLVQIFERTFTALRYITVFGLFRSIGITSSYAFQHKRKWISYKGILLPKFGKTMLYFFKNNATFIGKKKLIILKARKPELL